MLQLFSFEVLFVNTLFTKSWFPIHATSTSRASKTGIICSPLNRELTRYYTLRLQKSGENISPLNIVRASGYCSFNLFTSFTKRAAPAIGSSLLVD
jgi:hypothetical protein